MIRPVDVAPTQLFGDNPTGALPATHWIIKQFGNYQPDGHTGEDYPCKSGTPVRAVTSGTVLHVGRLGGTYADNPWWISPSFAGFVYVVDHGAFIGIYGHCQDGGARVGAGQRVNEGQVLGLSGNTGASTGDHLHFEILPDGYVLNSRMYGRINPATLFAGTIAAQSSIITPTEDDMPLSQQDIDTIRAIVREEVSTFGTIQTIDGKFVSIRDGVGLLLRWLWPIGRDGKSTDIRQELADIRTEQLKDGK